MYILCLSVSVLHYYHYIRVYFLCKICLKYFFLHKLGSLIVKKIDLIKSLTIVILKMVMKGVSVIYESISRNYINFAYSMCYRHSIFIRSFLWQSILKKIYAGQYDKAIQQMNAPLYTFLFSEYEKKL